MLGKKSTHPTGKTSILALGFASILPALILAQNVGVGTTSPQARLHIQVPSGFSGQVFRVDQAGAPTPYLVILPDGRAGIQTGSPQATLHVAGTGWFSDTLHTGGPVILHHELQAGGTPGQAWFVLTSRGAGQSPAWYHIDSVLVNSGSVGGGGSTETDPTAWKITGNNNVGPGNFLGTLSAVDLVIRTNNTERMRILGTRDTIGIFVANPAHPVEIQSGAVLPTGEGILHVVSTAMNSDAAAVYGQNNTTDFWGFGGYFVGGYTGVYGEVVASGNQNYRGVFGNVSGGSGTLYGGYFSAQNTSADAYGVLGYSQSTSASSTNSSAGVLGIGDATSNAYTYGVYGTTQGNSANQVGVFGVVNGGLAGQQGVVGWNLHASGTGILGAGNNLNQVYVPVSGAGISGNGEVLGIYGIALPTGASLYPMQGGYFTTFHTPSGDTPTAILAMKPDPATGVTSTGGFFDADPQYNAWALVGARANNIDYKVLGGGQVSTVISGPDGKSYVMFAVEGPEIWFMDMGVARFQNGLAQVSLDPIFASAIHVDEDRPLRVFVQVLGTTECGGVAIVSTHAQGFTAQAEHPCNAEFTYLVLGNRRSIYDAQGQIISRSHDVRFPEAPDIETLRRGMPRAHPVNMEVHRTILQQMQTRLARESLQKRTEQISGESAE